MAQLRSLAVFVKVIDTTPLILNTFIYSKNWNSVLTLGYLCLKNIKNNIIYFPFFFFNGNNTHIPLFKNNVWNFVIHFVLIWLKPTTLHTWSDITIAACNKRSCLDKYPWARKWRIFIFCFEMRIYLYKFNLLIWILEKDNISYYHAVWPKKRVHRLHLALRLTSLGTNPV